MPTGRSSSKPIPYGFFFEVAPKNAAIVWNNEKFEWTDDAWMHGAANAMRCARR